MRKNPFILITIFVFLALVLELNAKPNILVVISDDAGYADFGFHGNDKIPTPNLDRLASEGMVCTQGYVTASVCCPSRMGLMTGRYQQRFGAECNVPTLPTPGFTEEHLGLDKEEKTLADALKPGGYKSIMIGKWHLGAQEHHHPLNRGFDEMFGLLEGSRSYWPRETFSHGHNIIRNRDYIDEQKEITYLTDDLTSATIEFIDRHKETPFFIYLSYTAVHTPMHAKEEDIEQFDGIIDEDKRKKLAAMTISMDQNIGTVLKKLKDENLEKNTLVFFINDNGGATSNASDNLPLRGYKGSYWEGGIRVPYIVKFPGKVPAGKKYDKPVSLLDVFATSIAAAGMKAPGKPLDGVNLLPYLNGTKTSEPHEMIFWRLWSAAAVRKGPWKLIRIADNPLESKKELLAPVLLFNLEEDIKESKNRAEQNPEKVKELMDAIEQWEIGLSQPRWYDGRDWRKWQRVQVQNHQMNVNNYQ